MALGKKVCILVMINNYQQKIYIQIPNRRPPYITIIKMHHQSKSIVVLRLIKSKLAINNPTTYDVVMKIIKLRDHEYEFYKTQTLRFDFNDSLLFPHFDSNYIKHKGILLQKTTLLQESDKDIEIWLSRDGKKKQLTILSVRHYDLHYDLHYETPSLTTCCVY